MLVVAALLVAASQAVADEAALPKVACWYYLRSSQLSGAGHGFAIPDRQLIGQSAAAQFIPLHSDPILPDRRKHLDSTVR